MFAPFAYDFLRFADHHACIIYEILVYQYIHLLGSDHCVLWFCS